MERNRDCANCLNLGVLIRNGIDGRQIGLCQDICKIGRRVYVAKPCPEEIPKRSDGGIFRNPDDIRDEASFNAEVHHEEDLRDNEFKDMDQFEDGSLYGY